MHAPVDPDHLEVRLRRHGHHRQRAGRHDRREVPGPGDFATVHRRGDVDGEQRRAPDRLHVPEGEIERLVERVDDGRHGQPRIRAAVPLAGGVGRERDEQRHRVQAAAGDGVLVLEALEHELQVLPLEDAVAGHRREVPDEGVQRHADVE